jgi:two-component system OmpR family response regulator
VTVKILLVDDDVALTAALARGLRAEGFTIDVEHDGIDGLWRCAESTYDAIVLDIMLPGRNGFLVCRDLRARDDWTPILMLTAKDGELDEAEALDTGADDYLVKPFSYPVLVARLHALLRRASVGAPAPLAVSDLHVDPGTRSVLVEDQPVAMTAREFDVLWFLMRRAGQVVPKRTILDGVWSADFDGDPNIIEVYIARVRRHLEGARSGVAIETVRGAGYRLGSAP